MTGISFPENNNSKCVHPRPKTLKAKDTTINAERGSRRMAS